MTAAKLRRRATRKTTSKDRIERIVKTRWLVFHSPAQLLRDAAALVPEWRVQSMHVFGKKHHKDDGARCRLCLQFGCDKDGTSTSVSVTLEPQDVHLVLAYFIGQNILDTVVAFGAPQDKNDDDDGETLPVPTISEFALAQMAQRPGVH